MGIVLVFILAPMFLALVAGIVLLAIGLRGRLISPDPHCRACRFNLAGLPTGPDDARCPECGRSLTAPGAVRAGLRRKRPVLISLGALLLLVPLLIVGGVYFARSSPNLHALKPDFWLMLEARYANPGAVKPQLNELLARLQKSTLAQSDQQALFSRALEVQADHAGPWDPVWGDILGFAANNSLLTEEQFKSFARHAPDCTIAVRKDVVTGDDLVIQLHCGPSRIDASFGPGPRFVLRHAPGEVLVNDTLIYKPPSIRLDSSMGISAKGTGSMTTRRPAPGLAPGTHVVTIRWRFGIATDYHSPLLTEWDHEEQLTVNILPADSPGVSLIKDPAIQTQVLASLSLSYALELRRDGVDPTDAPNLSYQIRCVSPPMDLAFEVFARERLPADAPAGTQPREWRLGTVTYTRGGTMGYGGGADCPGFDAAAVDLVLRPSPDAARETLEIYRIWDGEVWFRNAPVKVLGDSAAAGNTAQAKPELPKPSASESPN